MIAVRGLSLLQGDFRLEEVAFEVPTGKYGVLMGRTGSGKTTILEAIAGLRPIERGSIVVEGRDVTGLAPAARAVGFVPQDAALFRTMTVYGNLAFALRVRRMPLRFIYKRVQELAGWLDLKHLLDRRAEGLSGGEAQRVALGRALSFEPSTLLLDEPLSSLDEDTRGQLVELLDSVRKRGDVTVLHVTHNRQEADALGDVVLRLEEGRVAVHSR